MVYSALEFQMKRNQKVMYNKIFTYKQKGKVIQRRLEKFLCLQTKGSDMANAAFWERRLYRYVCYWVQVHTTCCMESESAVLVPHSRPTLCNAMGSRMWGSSLQGILQARIMEWIPVSHSRGSSQPRNQTHVSLIAGEFFTFWATREAILLHDRPINWETRCWGKE